MRGDSEAEVERKVGELATFPRPLVPVRFVRSLMGEADDFGGSTQVETCRGCRSGSRRRFTDSGRVVQFPGSYSIHSGTANPLHVQSSHCNKLDVGVCESCQS